MENATEALHIGASVMIFVVALSISISAFGRARETAQLVLNYRDREYDYAYVENSGTTERIVNAETIVPSIYKAYKENYKIVFKGVGPVYQKRNTKEDFATNARIDIYSIDLEKDVLGSDEEKERFIRCLLYGSKAEYRKDIENFEKSGIFLNKSDFYGTIIQEGTKFKESLGVYYQEELQGQTDTPDANRTKKRVITYEKVN